MSSAKKSTNPGAAAGMPGMRVEEAATVITAGQVTGALTVPSPAENNANPSPSPLGERSVR